MPGQDVDEDALLREALAFIGDLDFGADVTVDEEDVWSSLLYDDGPDSFPSLPAIDPPLPVASVFAASPMCSSSELKAELVEPQTSSTQVAAESIIAPRQWPGASSRGKPKTQNPSRDRRREEIMTLRDLVGAHERRLTSLHPITSNVATVSSTDEPSELVGAWAHVATRQFERLQESEMENVRLKRLLQDQIQVGKNLERLLLKKRTTMESQEFDDVFDANKRIRGKNSWSRESSFELEELSACCARQYQETASVLAKFTDDLPVNDYRDVRLVHELELGLTVQLKERRILPFSYEDTANEAWQLNASDTPARSVHDFYDLDETEDILKFRVRMTADVNGSCGEFAVALVTRRFVEANRTVVVWSGIAKPIEISGLKMEGVRTRLSGWIIIEPLDPVDSRAATKVTTYHVSVPDVDDDAHDESRNVGTLTNFLLSTMVIDIDYRSQQWESRLLLRQQ